MSSPKDYQANGWPKFSPQKYYSQYCSHCDYEHPVFVDEVEFRWYEDECHNCGYELESIIPTEERPEDFYYKSGDIKVDNNVFTCFNRLPPELRVAIWKLALPGPRLVFLHYDGNSNGYVSPSTIPMLSACRESREIGKRNYVRAFGTKTTKPTTWFNYEIDTLYIQRYPNVYGGNPNDFLDKAKVRNLAIHLIERYNIGHSQSPMNLENKLHKLLSIFGNVKVLTNVQQRHGDPLHQSKNLELLDPVNIDRLLAFAQSHTIREKIKLKQGAHDAIGEVSFDFEFASEWPLELDSTAVDQQSLQSILDKENMQERKFRNKWKLRATTYEMPEIRQMIVTTSSLAARIREAQKIYEEAEEAHKLDIYNAMHMCLAKKKLPGIQAFEAKNIKSLERLAPFGKDSIH